MNILITGGAGYIGSHIIKHIGKRTDCDITIIDNLSTGYRQAILYGSFIQCDLSDFTRIKEILKSRQFNAIIHLAASIIVPESVKYPLKYYMNNTINTTNLVQCSIESGVDFKVSIESRRDGDPAELRTDNTKILRTLKWTPRYDDLALICKTALEWEKNRRY